MEWIPPPTGKRGRQQSFSDPDLFDDEGSLWHAPETDDRVRAEPTVAGRTWLERAGLQHPVPPPKDAEREHPLSRRYRPVEPVDPSRAMDSTGIKAEGESEWSAEGQKTVWETVFPTNAQARRTQTTRGGSTRKHWKSGLARSLEATLVTRLFYRSCSTRSRLTKISVPSRQLAPTTPGNATRQSLPVAPPPFVRERVLRTLSARSSLPPCKNARLRKPTSLAAVARNEALRASKYLGRAIWRRWSGDHRRSRVEAKMNGYTALETEDIAT